MRGDCNVTALILDCSAIIIFICTTVDQLQVDSYRVSGFSGVGIVQWCKSEMVEWIFFFSYACLSTIILWLSFLFACFYSRHDLEISIVLHPSLKS